MQASGFKVDHYTLCIMIKTMKRVNNHKDVVLGLELLDQADIGVCSGERELLQRGQ